MKKKIALESSPPATRYAIIWETVAKIPHGKVTTYGTIASLCGYSGQARSIGYALHALPLGIEIPWHRVVNAQGKISFSESSHNYKLQRCLLKKEGVRIEKRRIDFKKYGWLGGLHSRRLEG